MTERILCAAVHVDNGKEYPHQPVETGYVMCGHRHHNIIEQMAIVGIDRETRGKAFQGFLTSRGRYVDRREAAFIAMESGQTYGMKEALYSEDLY